MKLALAPEAEQDLRAIGEYLLERNPTAVADLSDPSLQSSISSRPVSSTVRERPWPTLMWLPIKTIKSTGKPAH